MPSFEPRERPSNAPSASVSIRETPMNMQFPEFELFSPKVEAAWTALRRQYASRITDPEIDHLFACFVLGLTSPAYAEQEPALHFDLCRALVAVELPPDRARTALHAVPEPTQPWVASACALIESQGAKIGRILQEKTSNFEDLSTAGANAATGSPGNTEENAK
ncbi:hypothetical protein MesoLjLc_72790 [Mesorhizobium sp. L-8-10]|uniref:hypothetical protein n=2 Tax=unclassified Mesorhizobium TaxID=325217 RepID=UPI0019388BA0|nr:hypothetical protein MesoLjLb_71770 [Mesorhizobium sp. L-8-3]BCH35349.1 hypothetical protein MesoLjLc_72790 [Mesorhizobium sp. L-8-10]